jgi:hypothetical protein
MRKYHLIFLDNGNILPMFPGFGTGPLINGIPQQKCISGTYLAVKRCVAKTSKNENAANPRVHAIDYSSSHAYSTALSAADSALLPVVI